MYTPETKVDQLALAIGNVCLRWAGIEEHLLYFIVHLAMAIDPAYERDEVLSVYIATVVNMEMRQKTLTAKALAHSITTPSDFYDRTEKLMNHIDNELRPERNRYFHDYWDYSSDTISRVRFGAKVERPQSRTRTLRITQNTSFQSVNEVAELDRRIEAAYHALTDLDSELASLSLEKGRS